MEIKVIEFFQILSRGNNGQTKPYEILRGIDDSLQIVLPEIMFGFMWFEYNKFLWEKGPNVSNIESF